MKLKTLLIVMTTIAALTNSQSAAAGEHAPSEQTIANQQLAYVAPSDRSYLSIQARASRITYSDDPNLFSGTTISDRTEIGLIENWRERVFSSLRKADLSPRGPETVAAQDQSAEMRVVAKIAMKETMRFAMDRLPEIDRLVKALKFEVSTDMIAKENEEATADATSILTSAARRPVVRDRFFMKTGLRIPIDSGKPALLSETDAVYGNVTSFFNLRIDSRVDSTMGMRYAVSEYVRLQVERQDGHTSDAGNRTITNLVKLVCTF